MIFAQLAVLNNLDAALTLITLSKENQIGTQDYGIMLEQGTTRLGVERTVSILVTNRMALSIGLIGLCGAYLQSGIDKRLDSASAVAETERLGLAPAIPIAVATIFTQFTASALLLSGFHRWFGALWLGRIYIHRNTCRVLLLEFSAAGSVGTSRIHS